VASSLAAWAETSAAQHPELLRLGCFGSFARGDWGVGSDLDLVAVVEQSDKPLERRSVDWDLTGLPVPADLLIFTQEEWERLQAEGGRFARTVTREAMWLFSRPAHP
jgi:predicted nucleotidyltransferase